MIKSRSRREPQEINAGSMADIAFLLLIFFLVVTTIQTQKGLLLPIPSKEEKPEVPIPERNLFNVKINSNNDLLVENEVRSNTTGLKEEVIQFILNDGKNPASSDNPQKAIISLKTNRGTGYGRFIEVLDIMKGAYYEIYGKRVGLSAQEYRELDKNNPTEYEMYLEGKDGIPMNISIAEPDKLN